MSIDIVAFPFHDWRKSEREGFRTRDGHLMQEFERHPEVRRLVVVNRPVSMAERLIRRPSGGWREVAATISPQRAATVTQVGEATFSIDVQVPDVVGPIRKRRGWWFDVFADHRVVETIVDAADEIGVRGAPTIAWVPTVSPAVQALAPGRFVFDALDNWLIHPVLRRHAEQARVAYEQLLRAADEVFVSAPRSAEALAEWRGDIEILPNGVDSATFRVAAPRPDDLPAGTVVGYAGKLADRIDAELVEAVARGLPHLEFVFIGPVLDRSAVRPLAEAPNVSLLGDRHYSMVPAYVRHFDVAWIPHRVGEGETGGDPIKLYEYWAAGRPVVSTPIDGMDKWKGQLELVNTPHEAVEAISRMLEQPVVPPVPPEREWSWIAHRLVRALAGAA